MDNRSFGVTIFTLEGFTARTKNKIIFAVLMDQNIPESVFYNRIILLLASTYKELLKELFWNYNRPGQMM